MQTGIALTRKCPYCGKDIRLVVTVNFEIFGDENKKVITSKETSKGE